jgi:acyl-CoA thioester hydrolase
VDRYFEHPLRVRYGECDPQGIVFNANYLLYFDVAFTELWRAALGPWQALKDAGVDLVVANASIDFRASARFDDELILRARVARLGTTSITTELDVLRDGKLLVAGRLVHVCVDASDFAKTELPDWVRVGLRPYANGDAESGAGGSTGGDTHAGRASAGGPS